MPNYPPFDTDYIRQIRILSARGATQREVAQLWDVPERTLIGWRRVYPAFKEAWDEGTDEFLLGKAETALVKRAIGYDFAEITEETAVDIATKDVVRDENGDPKLFTTKIVHKHVKPSETALQYLMNNLAKRIKEPGKDPRWQSQNKIEIDHGESAEFSPEKFMAAMMQAQQATKNELQKTIEEGKKLGIEYVDETDRDALDPETIIDVEATKIEVVS